jgi:NADPH:quinone reductase-like Zn-dependent oxidoreductase
MKAVVYSHYGGPEVLQHVELDTPTPAAGEVLIKVHAAALNPADWHLMRGMPFPIRIGRGLTRPTLPQRIGLEYAGTVAAVGCDVRTVAAGDAVFGSAGSSTLAEYIVAPASDVVAKPENVTFERAAGTSVAGVTALRALRNAARVQPGHKVLVNGASGGVGTFAVQLAKIFGAEVTAVQSTRNVELVRSLGADQLIDYTAADFTSDRTSYDVVLDNVRNRSLAEVRRVLKPGGVYLPNSGGSPKRNASMLGILGLLAISPFLSHKIRFFLATPNHDDLQTLAGLMRDGRLTTVIDTTYSFDDAAQAMRHLESGHARGKIVVRIA